MISEHNVYTLDNSRTYMILVVNSTYVMTSLKILYTNLNPLKACETDAVDNDVGPQSG